MDNQRSLDARKDNEDAVKTRMQSEHDTSKGAAMRSESQTDNGATDRSGSERSPLLGDSQPVSVDGEEQREEQWAGEFDFVGLPWYRTPSVGTLLMLHQAVWLHC